MEPIRKLADVVIDTSKFNVHELRQFIMHRFQKTDRRPMMVALVSFGYSTGFQRMPTSSSMCVFYRIRISFPSCANFPGATRASPATSAPFLKPESSCGASRVC